MRPGRIHAALFMPHRGKTVPLTRIPPQDPIVDQLTNFKAINQRRQFYFHLGIHSGFPEAPHAANVVAITIHEMMLDDTGQVERKNRIERPLKNIFVKKLAELVIVLLARKQRGIKRQELRQCEHIEKPNLATGPAGENHPKPARADRLCDVAHRLTRRLLPIARLAASRHASPCVPLAH